MRIKNEALDRSIFVMHCMYLHLCTGYKLGKLSIQLEELGDELGEQFDELAEFSIQLEEQRVKY